MPKALAGKLKEQMAQTDTTMYMMLFSIYNITLARYSGQDDIVVGSLIKGRNHSDLFEMMGMFVNTLAMRSHPAANKTFAQFLEEVRETTLHAFENQDYQFEDLVEQLKIAREPARNPLFDVMFSLHNMSVPEVRKGDLIFSQYDSHSRISKYDLCLFAEEKNNTMVFKLEYCTKLFKAVTIQRFAKHFVYLASQIAQNPQVKLGDLHLSDEDERTLLFEGFNETAAAYPREMTIHRLFEEQVKLTPNSIAVRSEEEQISYKELNRRADRVASMLRQEGVRQDSIVGLMVERSVEMIVGIMGILKAGGAYMPIDPAYPAERVSYMMNHSQASILLSRELIRLSVDSESEQLESSAEKSIHLEAGSRHLLYVIYTSGTTGTPKGVMIEHQNMVNLLHYQFTQMNIPRQARILQYTSIGFDVSAQEIFSALLSGSQLHLVSPEVRQDPLELFEHITSNHINVLYLPVSLLKFIFHSPSLAEKFPRCVEHIVTAGEQLIVTERLKQHLHRFGVYLHNQYGPSETHVVTVYTIIPGMEANERPPIGRPISNTEIYILDENLQPVPIGVKGELFVSGESVGRGYLHQSDLTAEKYLKHPFVAERRMYRTGDLARWLPDGNIEYLGRTDHQVKIRGFRVELGEVENHLLQHNAIQDAIVLAKEDKQKIKYLCAYYVSEQELTVRAVREYLSHKLPDYMIPSHLVLLDVLPVTSNGKVDRRALPEPDEYLNTGVEYAPPTTDLEKQILEIWCELLGSNRIGINDNFFELGGHSLKATQLMAIIRGTFKTEISLGQIFKDPTVKGVARYIHSGSVAAEEDNLVLLVEGHNQERILFFIHTGEGGVLAFEMARQLEQEGETMSFLGLIDALAPQCDDSEDFAEFTLENERELLVNQMVMQLYKEELNEIQQIERLWSLYVRYLQQQNPDLHALRSELPKEILQAIPHAETLGIPELFRYFNIIRTFHNAQIRYNPECKVQVPIHYFKAEMYPPHHASVWTSFCNAVHVHQVDGDHYSIIASSNVVELAVLFSQAVSSELLVGKKEVLK
ncbi:amino acid adenylation domain-containing protein [Paenibacillus sp. NPDC057934]|uniref:non-ribosomal peptide synthetase n=1 Tax=Paenibacillus sp. NPDC057934 TaxID=3346282 RepID=UPI0036DEFDCC